MNMDFATVIGFIFLYFIRPQEWIGFLESKPVVFYWMLLAIAAMLVHHRGLRFRDLLKTPHDWMIILFFIWVVSTAVNTMTAFRDLRNLTLFYIVIVQALYNRKRLIKFLHWWTLLLFTLTFLGVASEFGFDPTHAYDITHSLSMKGRLCLGMSLYNNPNSLAHSVLPCIMMFYFLYLWRRPPFVKEVLGLLMTFPFWCIYLTQSRGGYMAASLTVGISMLFGRHWILQVLIFGLLLGIGPPVIKSFRGLQRADDKGLETGVQGRKMAFRFGLHTLREKPFKGLGYRQFRNYSPWKIEVRHVGKKIVKIRMSRIAPHSAYVAIGAEQGRLGLFLWLGIFYCSLRTLLLSKCADENDERIRRLLLSATLAYLISSWFTDFEYQAAFFILHGAVAAFHRIVRIERTSEPAWFLNPPAVVPGAMAGRPTPPSEPSRTPAPPPAPGPDTLMTGWKPVSPCAPAPGPGAPRLLKVWNRIGWLDIVLMLAFTGLVIRLWQYLSINM
ncbi:MAG: O-antigen ligase family protein [Lentisphaerae bacterium]|nr:O-antigen ligase family protein [Lentisphaerota bacterium]